MDSGAPRFSAGHGRQCTAVTRRVTRGRGLLVSAKDPSSRQMPPRKEEAGPPPEGSRGGAQQSL